MFGDDGTDSVLPVSMTMDNIRLPYNTNAVPPRRLDALFGCNTVTTDVFENKISSMPTPPSKVGWWDPVVSQHKDSVTIPDTTCVDGGGVAKRMRKLIPVSTGLQLSYGAEYNSLVSSATENTTTNLFYMASHCKSLHTELAHQKDEFDRYFRVQEENIKKGMAELKHRHTVSLLNAVQNEVCAKLHQKDIEIETLHRDNKELSEKIKQLSVEAQYWQIQAKQNELVVSDLKGKMKQISLQVADSLKEGMGESVVDDVSSCNRNPNNLVSDTKEWMNCKACEGKEISVLLLPCRHLCICIECDAFVDSCPVCGVKKAVGLQVHMF